MRPRKTFKRFGTVGMGFVAVAAAITIVTLGPRFARKWLTQRPYENVATAPVRQADINVSLVTSGQVESENRTIIRCELKHLETQGRGQTLTGGGASTVISLIPDGSPVKTGDVLCRLDSSMYEEMVRQQQIVVEQAKSEHRQAQLDVEVAKLSLVEFREGSMTVDLKEMDGQTALADSELKHAGDRLAWTRRMQKKGYASTGQLRTDEFNYQRMTYTLAQSRVARTVYERFTVPRTVRTLESQIKAAEATLAFEKAKLDRSVDRLAMLNLQVERCTIRAPHDGFVVYANDPRKGFVIEEGMTVREKQKLFFLPDLGKMEVEALFHETVVSKIRNGMPARVRIEAFPGKVLEGRITKVAPIASQNFMNDVRYFAGIISLDTFPQGLLPGMSAEVEVLTDRRHEVLTMPTEALAFENGNEVCYVARDGSLERREIKVGGSNRELIEVTEGLEPGEQVVLDPENMDRETLAALGAEADGEKDKGPSATGEAQPAAVTH